MKRLIFSFCILLLLAAAGCDRLPGATTSAAPTNTVQAQSVRAAGDVIVEGSIVPLDTARLLTRTGGKIAEVPAEEGQQVTAGTVLVRLEGGEAIRAERAAAELERLVAQQVIDNLNQTAALAEAQAQAEANDSALALIEAQQALDDLDTDTYETELDNARSEVGEAEDALEDAQDEFDRYKDNAADNSNRQNAEDRLEDAQLRYNDAVRERDRLINQMDTAAASVDAAQARLDDARRRLDDGYPDPQEIAQAEARLAAAEAQLAAVDKALADLEITAPFDATVVELEAGAGETMVPNQVVAVLADFTAMVVETTDLTEMDVVSVREGQQALVTPDALPDLTLSAVVEKIDQSAGQRGGDVTYTVRLRLNETDPRLLWGMTVEVVFED